MAGKKLQSAKKKKMINNTTKPKIAINKRRCFSGNICRTFHFSGDFKLAAAAAAGATVSA